MLKIKRIFIKDHLSLPLRHLYAHTIIRGLATGLLGFFIPIFLFNIFGKIEYVIIYYLIAYAASALIYPLTTRIFLKLDLKILMMLATPCIIIYLILLNRIETTGLSISLIICLIIAITFYRMFYWIPYHTEFATFTNKRYRGRELSILQASISLIGISLPAISGFIIVKFGFNWLFSLAILLHFISIIPLFKIPRKKETFSYKYFETWKKLFSQKNFHIFIAYFADGFQAAAGYVCWPIFIFLVLKGEYLSVGIISTLVILITVVLRLVIGDLSDHRDKHKLLKAGSILFAGGWLFKTFVETAFQVFFIGAYHGLSEILMRSPFDTLMYDRAADQGHYIDEYTVLREMSLLIGRIALLLMALIVLTLAPINWVFVIVALVTLLVNLI
ncbi:MAG: MFS transporter [Candidatus Kuenenbacteria bacterium]